MEGNTKESGTGAVTMETSPAGCNSRVEGGITRQPNSLGVKHLESGSLGQAELSLPGRSWELQLLSAAGPEELREEASVLP